MSATKDKFDGCSDGKPKPRFTPLAYSDLKGRPRLSWIIKKVLPCSELVLVFGESGSGKSFFTLDMVMAIARGIPWFGHKVKQGRVVYICAESAAGFIGRVEGYLKRHGLEEEAIDNFRMISLDLPNFMEHKDLMDLCAGIGAADVIVVDTLARVTAGADENSGEDMGLVLGNCQKLHAATGATVILVHHSGKDKAKGARGWSGIKGALDTQIYVEKIGEGHKATITKQKDGPEGESWDFDLVQHVLGQDEDGEEITTCVFEPAEHFFSEQKRDRKPGPWEDKIIKSFDYYGESLVLVEDVIQRAVETTAKDPDKKDKRRDYALRALNSLIAKERFCLKYEHIYEP